MHLPREIWHATRYGSWTGLTDEALGTMGAVLVAEINRRLLSINSPCYVQHFQPCGVWIMDDNEYGMSGRKAYENYQQNCVLIGNIVQELTMEVLNATQ